MLEDQDFILGSANKGERTGVETNVGNANHKENVLWSQKNFKKRITMSKL